MPPEALAENPSIQLLLQRVQAVQPDFLLTAHNAVTLAEVCDGWALPAAGAVCQECEQWEKDVVDELASLLDKSLVRRVVPTEDEPHFLLAGNAS